MFYKFSLTFRTVLKSALIPIFSNSHLFFCFSLFLFSYFQVWNLFFAQTHEKQITLRLKSNGRLFLQECKKERERERRERERKKERKKEREREGEREKSVFAMPVHIFSTHTRILSLSRTHTHTLSHTHTHTLSLSLTHTHIAKWRSRPTCCRRYALF